jgi:hypothetical protein
MVLKTSGIGLDVRVERDLDDVSDTLRGERADAADDLIL